MAAPRQKFCWSLVLLGVASDTNYNGLLAFVCDGFWFLNTAFEAGGATALSAASFVDGENRLSTSYIPASITSTRMGPDRHDGVGSIRPFAFVDACSCFRYSGDRVDI